MGIAGRSGALELLNYTENSPRVLIKSASRVRFQANRTLSQHRRMTLPVRREKLEPVERVAAELEAVAGGGDALRKTPHLRVNQYTI